ncbi:MAG: hypothetical protein IPM77_07165 [Crocinitomicaceae bacterium]|nr:hypothetical protein [Crocinitomicaceae bacterium]
MVTFSQSDTLNQKDTQGLKQGYWILDGKDFPEKGFCDSCKVEEGPYKDDRKTGLWQIYHKNGILRVKASFVNGRPSGYYEKYYENGILQETGYFAYGKFKGSFHRYYENGCIQTEKYYDMNGNDSLPVFHYYDNCDTSISKYGSIEFKREKSETGLIVDSSFYKDRTYKPKYPKEQPTTIDYSYTIVLPAGLGGPDGSLGITKNGPFNPNGYNKVYKGNLWMDGEFGNFTETDPLFSLETDPTFSLETDPTFSV